VLAILAMLAPKRRCAWLRVAPLLPSPPLHAAAAALPGRDGKAGSLIELESWAKVSQAFQSGCYHRRSLLRGDPGCKPDIQ
jgi:hypothetical protein